MRILVIQPTSDKMGHYGIYTVKLCQALGKYGHSVTLCTNKVYPEQYISEPLAFTVEEIHGGRLSFKKYDRAGKTFPAYYWWGYFSYSFQVTSAAFRLHPSRDFDVVYLTDAEFLMASLVLKWYGGNVPPVVMQVNAANFSFSTYAGSVIKKAYKVFQREVFKSVLGKEIRAISILGEWHRDRLRSQFRLGEDYPIAVIPDGGEVPPCVISKEEARQRLGIDFRGPIILFFGMLRKDKGIETLLEAIGQLEAEDFRLVIAGYPTDYSSSEVMKLIDRSVFGGKVIARLSYVSDADVPYYYFASDVAVMPYGRSYTGGSGPLLKGACTYGRPIIASNVSEMGRLVRQFSMGLVCEPGNPAALAGTIRKFLAMPGEERNRMGARASTLARQNSWEAMAKRYTSLFEDVVRSKSS